MATISLLTVYLVYPLFWFLAYSVSKKYKAIQKALIMSLSMFLIALGFSFKFIGFDYFFDFKYGAFQVLLGMSLSPLIYFPLKKRVTTPK